MISRLSFTYPSPTPALSPFQNHSLYPTINCWVSLRLRPRPFPSFTLFLIPGASHLYAQHLPMPLLISQNLYFQFRPTCQLPAGQLNLNVLRATQANKSKGTQVLSPIPAVSLGVSLLEYGTISHPVAQTRNLSIIPDKFLSLTTPYSTHILYYQVLSILSPK